MIKNINDYNEIGIYEKHNKRLVIVSYHIIVDSSGIFSKGLDEEDNEELLQGGIKKNDIL